MGFVYAQEFRGTILGRVTDSSGVVAANCPVTVTNENTNTVVKTATTQGGTYTVPFLVPGSYTIAVQAAGFRAFQRQNVIVRVQDRIEIDAVLEPGSARHRKRLSCAGRPPLLRNRQRLGGPGGQTRTALPISR